jgi:uncharacterized protein YceK
MTAETRTTLLIAVLAAVVLLAGCATLVASDSGEESEPEGPLGDVETGNTDASETATDASTTEQPATVDVSEVADAMASIETVSFEVNQSTALAGQSQSVTLAGAVDTDRGEARLETTVDSPFGTQSWASYVVNGTVYSEVGDTWTRADVPGTWNDTLAGGAFAGDALASDALTLDVVRTTTFDGNDVYVVEPRINESTLAEAQSGFIGNVTARFGDNQNLDGLLDNIESEFDGTLSDAEASGNNSLGGGWVFDSGTHDGNHSEEWGSEGDTFEWNLSEEWNSEGNSFEWNFSKGWDSEGDTFDWNLSEEWDSEGDTFEWNNSSEWTFGEGSSDDGESGFMGAESLGDVNTTMYIDTETSHVRYVETTVSVGEDGEFGTVSTSTTFENFGSSVEIDLPAEAEDAESLWPRP